MTSASGLLTELHNHITRHHNQYRCLFTESDAPMHRHCSSKLKTREAIEAQSKRSLHMAEQREEVKEVAVSNSVDEFSVSR